MEKRSIFADLEKRRNKQKYTQKNYASVSLQKCRLNDENITVAKYFLKMLKVVGPGSFQAN